tara:strand:+ start:2072 stop:3520 length:1449 start_codon:yes stop_codon:yes gene_type:complete
MTENISNLPVKKKRGRKPKIKLQEGEAKSSDGKTKSPEGETKISDGEIIIDSKIPKKRGRKPKIITNPEEHKIPVKKKRGRKPKIKDPDEKPKVLKKRGRKPKMDSVENVKKINSTFNVDTENIIVHLPIKTTSVPVQNKDEKLFEYNPNISSPTAYEDNIIGKNVDNCVFISQKDNESYNELCGKGPTPVSNYVSYPFDEKHKDIIDILDSKSDDINCENNETVVNNNNIIEDNFEIKHVDSWLNDEDASFINNNQGIDKIMDHIKQQRKDELDNLNFKAPKTKVQKCLVQMEQMNKHCNWPSSTSIYCWWCCHPFNGPPCALPCNIKDNVFSVLGIFCSPECAAAYNFNDTSSGTDLWERYSLLNLLYRKVYTDNNIKIKLAPPKECLKIFGGNLTIKEFRLNNANFNNTYKITMPPITSIIPLQEISDIDDGFSSNDSKVYMLDKNKILDNELKLKRKTPFNVKNNTLQKCMNLSMNNN